MADSEIGFHQLGLASILKQNQLAVPPNQREYSLPFQAKFSILWASTG